MGSAFNTFADIGPKSLSPIQTTKALYRGPPRGEEVAAPGLPDDQLAAARRRARRRVLGSQQAEPTLLTGPAGLTAPATTAPKTLLGV